MNWCIASALVFIGSIAGGPQRSPLRFDEWHHEYMGAAACAVGKLTHSKLTLRIGQVLSADDAVQHLYQRMNGNLAISSPITITYRATLAHVPVVNWLNRALDALLK